MVNAVSDFPLPDSPTTESQTFFFRHNETFFKTQESPNVADRFSIRTISMLARSYEKKGGKN